MYHILITGAGKIGCLIAALLLDSLDYEVHLADKEFSGADVTRLLQARSTIKTAAMDVNNQESLQDYIKKHQIHAVISSLPYFLNTHVAVAAKNTKIHYFDLTEDTLVKEAIKSLARDTELAFVPQCGLAPGFISIIAHSLLQDFDQCHHARLRVGALPQCVSNTLHYSLTWSTDGLINEYGNPCHVIDDGIAAITKPLEGLERIQLYGSEFEAFNTSGGIGGLSSLYLGKIHSLNYKTIRYPGHCEKMRFLMNDLRLNEDRATLKILLERVIPKTYQDMVIIYVSVEGIKNGELIEKSYVKKIYPREIGGLSWTAIQISTASGVCALVDLVLQKPENYHGLIEQEAFCLHDVLTNRFGKNFS